MSKNNICYYKKHKVILISGEWVYEDNGMPITESRLCKGCNEITSNFKYDVYIYYKGNQPGTCIKYGILN